MSICAPQQTTTNEPLYNYTLMSTHMRFRFNVEDLRDIELQSPFAFTKGCQTMKIAARRQPLWIPFFETLLFDTQADPGQLTPMANPAVETDMIEKMVDLMRANDAPPEQYQRVGLPA